MVPDAPFLLDPRLEELLREVAADPDACLLRVPRERTARALSRGELPQRASVRATALKAAERELVRVHHADLAHLLREQCARRLSEDAETAPYLYLVDDDAVANVSSSGGTAFKPLASAECLGSEEAEPATTARELLERCTADTGAARPSVAQLAAASQRLAPAWEARIYVAYATLLSGNQATGLRLAERVIVDHFGQIPQAFAWEAIGLARMLTGDLERAFAAYGAAARLDPSRPGPLLSALIISMELGRESECVDWDSRARNSAITPGTTSAFVDRHKRLRAIGAWNPSKSACIGAQGIAERAGRIAWEVARAF